MGHKPINKGKTAPKQQKKKQQQQQQHLVIPHEIKDKIH